MPDQNRPHIVIVGAGIAGLTAAIKIGEGVDARVGDGRFKVRPDITILEGDNATGGRARTDILSNGLTVDAGPHWFHGGESNHLYQWATKKKRYALGPISLDTAKNRVNLSSGDAMSTGQREWGLTRLFEMYAMWQSQHPGQDIPFGQLARMGGDPQLDEILTTIAEERANNWMAVENADQVSSMEYFGDDAGSGGMQIEGGMEKLITAMTEDVEYYKADIHTRTNVRGIFERADKRIKVLTDKKDYVADHVIVTPSIGVLKSGAIQFDDYVNSQLVPILDGMTPAKMTKIFMPLRPQFFAERGIKPDTFLTFYDTRHPWLFHLHTDGKPTVTIFASGAMSELVESQRPASLEQELFALLNRVEPLKGVENYLDGRVMRTDWTTNGNYLCAYSAMRPGHVRRNPLIVGNLIFAGEAWVKNMNKSPSTMAGAFASGAIAARKTLEKLSLKM